METEIIHTVLREVLDELKEVKQKQGEESSSILHLREKMEKIEEKLPVRDSISRATNSVTITSRITNELAQIKELVEAQPKSIAREFRVLLFPEHNATEYYRIVFGRLIFWMTMILISTYLFVLGKEYIAENARAKQLQAEADHYKKAWNHLYKSSKKSTRKKMDSAWVKVLKDYE
jgi:hypothetical protein